MALQKSYNKNAYGQTLTFDQAYHKITFISGNKDSIAMQVTIYNNNNKEYEIDKKDYGFIPSVDSTSKNFIQQGYEYLKTLDEFKDTIDLLD